MKQADDQFTQDAFDKPRRGRPPQPSAKTAAQRMREYRQRIKARYAAHPQSASISVTRYGFDGTPGAAMHAVSLSKDQLIAARLALAARVEYLESLLEGCATQQDSEAAFLREQLDAARQACTAISARN